MKVVKLEAENFKRLHAVEITPDGNMVVVGGKNGSGKSSVLDAIYVALKGRAVGPPQPVRQGEEKCHIRLDLGDLVVTRTFIVKEGAPFTDSLKVENSEGLRYSKPQDVLDALLGEIGFDPFAFCQMKAKDQAEALLGMVPLPVDLDELAEADESDFLNRRDLNREAAALKAQIDGIAKEEVPADLPDREALQDQLARAAETNAGIERDRMARERTQQNIAGIRAAARGQRDRAKAMRDEADRLDSAAKGEEEEADILTDRFAELPALAEPVDAEAIRSQLRTAEATLAMAERQRRRAELEVQHAAKAGAAEKLTEAMATREKERQAALAKAKMPIKGLAFGLDEKGKPMVKFGGVPFEQASTAEQLRASTAIAMAANPQLRVLRVKDGSLLDEESIKLLGELADAEDFQLFIEVVSTGDGVGIIMEAGKVVGGTLAKAAAKPKPAKADAEQLL